MAAPVCINWDCPESLAEHFEGPYSLWFHDRGVPAKVTAQLMGPTNVDMTLNVYTQVMDDSPKIVVERIGQELFAIARTNEAEAKWVASRELLISLFTALLVRPA